jgi:hypothetical protein
MILKVILFVEMFPRGYAFENKDALWTYRSVIMALGYGGKFYVLVDENGEYAGHYFHGSWFGLPDKEEKQLAEKIDKNKNYIIELDEVKHEYNNIIQNYIFPERN